MSGTILLVNLSPTRDTTHLKVGTVAEEYFATLQEIGTKWGDQRHEPNNGLLFIGKVLLNAGFDVKYLDLNVLEYYARSNGNNQYQHR